MASVNPMDPPCDAPLHRGRDRLRPPSRTAYHDLLPADVAVAWARSTAAARAVWTGVVWSRLARCDLAWAWWDRAIDASARSPVAGPQPDRDDPRRTGAPVRPLAPWVAAERGRCLRELGLHGAAQDLESPALAAAADPVDAAMLRISLVADAVGLAQPAPARTQLDAARHAVAALPEGPRAARQRLRLAWVDVEVALLTGAVPPSAGVPNIDDVTGAPRLPPDHAHGSRFHTAKGLLFGAVVHDDARLLDAALVPSPPMLRWAVLLAIVDRGDRGAIHAARRAWRRITPPPGWEDQVAASAAARRLG